MMYRVFSIASKRVCPPTYYLPLIILLVAGLVSGTVASVTVKDQVSTHIISATEMTLLAGTVADPQRSSGSTHRCAARIPQTGMATAALYTSTHSRVSASYCFRKRSALGAAIHLIHCQLII